MASPQAPTAAGDSAQVADQGTSAVPSKPSNVAEGDAMVAILERAGVTTTITPPSGWSERSNTDHDGGNTTTWTKVAGASEPSTYTWSWSSSSKYVCIIQRVTGADTTTPVAGVGTPATGDNDTPDPPEVSGLTSDDYLAVTLVGQEGASVTFTPSTNYTENAEGGTSGGPPGANCAAHVQHREFTGTSENPGTVSSSDSDGWCAVTIVFAPGASGPTYSEDLDLGTADGALTVTDAQGYVEDLDLGTADGALTVTDTLGGGGPTYSEDLDLGTADGALVVTDAQGYVEDLDLGTADGALTVTDTLGGGGPTYSEDLDLGTADGALVVTDAQGYVEDLDLGTADGALVVADAWSGDLNLQPVTWQLQMALGVDGGLGALWDTGLWDTTGTWAATEPTWVTVTADALSARPSRGRTRWEDRFIAGDMTVELRNETGKYNPDEGADPPGDLALRAGRLIRLRADVGEGWVAVWRGVIDDIRETYAPAGGDVVTTIYAYDEMGDLAGSNPPASSSQGAGEDTDERVARVLDDYGWPDALRDLQSGVHTMQATTLARSHLEEIQRAAQAEGGAFFIGKDGTAVFKARDWLTTDTRSTVAQLQPGSGLSSQPHIIGVSPASWSRQSIVNDVQWTRVGGSAVEDEDATSIALYGRRSSRITDLECETDAQVTALVDRYLTARAYDRQRVDELRLWAETPAAQKNVLELELGDLITATITTLHGWSYSFDAHVNRITHDISEGHWITTLRVDAALAYDPT